MDAELRATITRLEGERDRLTSEVDTLTKQRDRAYYVLEGASEDKRRLTSQLDDIGTLLCGESEWDADDLPGRLRAYMDDRDKLSERLRAAEAMREALESATRFVMAEYDEIGDPDDKRVMDRCHKALTAYDATKEQK